MLKNMFDRDALMNKFFKKIEDTFWDLSTGKIGLHTSEGIATIDGEGDSATISINPIEQFGIPLPSFARSTSLADVKVGDLIYGNTTATKGWVVEIKTTEAGDGTKNYKFVLLTPSGTQHSYNPPKVQMFGIAPNGVMVVQSLFNMAGAGGLADMKNNLLPLMMMGGDMEDIGDMLPMLMMGGMNGSAPAAAGGGMGQMLQTMMMMKMFKGKSDRSRTNGGRTYFDGDR